MCSMTMWHLLDAAYCCCLEHHHVRVLTHHKVPACSTSTVPCSTLLLQKLTKAQKRREKLAAKEVRLRLDDHGFNHCVSMKHQ